MNPTPNLPDSQVRPLDAAIEGEHSLRALSRAAIDRVSTQATQGVHDAGEALHLRTQALTDQMRHARDSGSEVIRAHPLRAVAVAAGLGAGLVLLLGLMARLRGNP